MLFISKILTLSCTEVGIYLYKMVDRNYLPFQSTPGFQWGLSYSIFRFLCNFCISLFVFWPLCCLCFFDLRILITPLVSIQHCICPSLEVAVIYSHIHNYISGLLCNGHLKLSRNTSRCENNSYYKHGR